MQKSTKERGGRQVNKNVLGQYGKNKDHINADVKYSIKPLIAAAQVQVISTDYQ